MPSKVKGSALWVMKAWMMQCGQQNKKTSQASVPGCSMARLGFGAVIAGTSNGVPPYGSHVCSNVHKRFTCKPTNHLPTQPTNKRAVT